MSDFSKFRTALNGFNRSDVTEYIESSALNHQKELRQLNDEVARLNGENAALTEKLRAAQLALASARLEAETLRHEAEENLAAQEAAAAEAAEKERLAAEAAERERLAAVEAAEEQTDEADTVEAEPSLTEKELEAYRRAEAMERNAQLRAEKLGGKIDALCESARARCAESGGELAALRQDLGAMIDRLQETLADVQLIFDETEEAFDALDMAAADTNS